MKRGIFEGKDMKKTGLGKSALLVFGCIVACGTALTYAVDKIYELATKGKEEEKNKEEEEEIKDGE